jgi:DNA-binding transcriptional LysR family regulator
MKLDDVPAFLALARHQRLGPAGERLGISYTTIARRVASLERSLGGRLFDRTPDGWILTDAGARFYDEAVKVEAAADEAFEAGTRLDFSPHGAVRLVTTDGFGVAAVARWAGLFLTTHPDIRLEMVTSSRQLAFTSREFDLAITVHAPDLRDVETIRLTDYALGLYASPNYLKREGVPSGQRDLIDHDFVWFVESMQDLPELHLLHPIVPNPRIVFQSTSVLGQLSAVVAGAGLGLLPRFMVDEAAGIVAVLPDEVEIRRTYWLITPKESQRRPAVRATAEFLIRMSTKPYNWTL